MRPLPVAVIRRFPADFVVDEIPAYAPSGRGEHLYVTFRKVGRTTPDVVRDLARALDVDARGAGHAGMKDRHAVTTQAVTFPFPIARDAEGALRNVVVPGVEILSAERHHNKLKPGHLTGNRFTIVLRDIPSGEVEPLRAALEELGRSGVPNAFGAQRFGQGGTNPDNALKWLAGETRGPRDRRDQRFLFSSLQSMLFNRVLERRREAGTWRAVLAGDLAKKHDTGGLFSVPLEGPELEEARARADAGAICATGPMFGPSMRWPEGEPLALEREVLAEVLGDPSRLDAFRRLGEGTRRPFRLLVENMRIERASMEPSMERSEDTGLVVRFVLPKGGYATTVLGSTCTLHDERGLGTHGAADGPSNPSFQTTEGEGEDEDEPPRAS